MEVGGFESQAPQQERLEKKDGETEKSRDRMDQGGPGQDRSTRGHCRSRSRSIIALGEQSGIYVELGMRMYLFEVVEEGGKTRGGRSFVDLIGPSARWGGGRREG